MNNFGVIELASAKTTSAPGWAYVPDTAVGRSSNALPPAHRKRARNAPGLSLGDLSARQETKRRKEIGVLDRDGGRDNSIPLPAKGGRGKAHAQCPQDTAISEDLRQPPRRLPRHASPS
ncbi:hypothetical protein G7046_g8629 [Stylonectria norvegica]|nr:hypothetical protein G7046_g8629 [Stylonectria norvegica]